MGRFGLVAGLLQSSNELHSANLQMGGLARVGSRVNLDEIEIR